MLYSVKIQRCQSEIRQVLGELVQKETPTEDETRQMGDLDTEYRTNETRYRAALTAEDEERRDAGADHQSAVSRLCRGADGRADDQHRSWEIEWPAAMQGPTKGNPQACQTADKALDSWHSDEDQPQNAETVGRCAGIGRAGLVPPGIRHAVLGGRAPPVCRFRLRSNLRLDDGGACARQRKSFHLPLSFQ